MAKHQTLIPISPLLIDNWLRGERGFPTPLEWTLKVWGAYSGDLQPAPFAALNTLFVRFGGGVSNSRALEVLAQEFILREQSAIPYVELDKLLTSLVPATPVFIEPPQEDYQQPLPEPERKKIKPENKPNETLSCRLASKSWRNWLRAVS